MQEIYFMQWSLNPIILAVFISVTALIFSILVSYSNGGSSSPKPILPPSPPGLPVLGNLRQLSSLAHRSLHSLAQKYGPVMLVHIGQAPIVVISSPELAKEVLKTQDSVFAGRPSVKSATKALTYWEQTILLSDYGDHWRQLKKLCTVHLLSPKMVKSFWSLREEQVSIMVESIRRSASKETTVNLSKVLYEYTNGTIIRGVTGSQTSSSMVASFRQIFEEGLALMTGFQIIHFIFPFLWWFGLITGTDSKLKTVIKKWDTFLTGVVDGPRGEKKDGFVDVLLALQKDPALELLLTKDIIKAVTMEMKAGGTDTSYTVLEWTMSELIRHPKVLQKAKLEIASVSKGKASVPEDDLEKMPYLKAVIKEAMRMHPPVPLMFPHKTMEDALLHGINIPKNTNVIINVWSIARDPNWWESPDEFMPERFMNSDVDFKGQHYQLLPFGAGRRICPGLHFGITSVEVAIANLLYMFDWELPKGKEALDMEELPGLIVKRAKKLELVAKPCVT